MKLRENWKRFWTLSRHHEGFTLVELIVVIAILAILAGVGVPAYSGYVEKANMQADITLASEVRDALLLHYYENAGEDINGYVVLTPEGEVCLSDENGVGDAAMVAAFGDGWENNLSLKYDGWQSSGAGVGAGFIGSSLDGKQEELMGTVDVLAGTLKGYLEFSGDYGDGFEDYLSANGIEKDTIGAANAAVLYVAETVQKADQEKIASALSGISATYADKLANDPANANPQKIITDAVLEVRNEVGGSTLATAAVLYAYVESYCQASGKTMDIDFDAIQDGNAGVNEVINAFVDVMKVDQNTPEDQLAFGSGYAGLVDGWDGPTAVKDAEAVLSILGAVDTASDVLIKDVNTENYYSSKPVINMVNSFVSAAGAMKAGDVLVFVTEDGTVVVDGLSNATN